jgi:hypothetical protein
MDIRLHTNADDPSLELRGCRALDDVDFESFLIVRSGPFQAQISFWFDRASLEATLACLEQMQSSLSGQCKLGYRREESFVSFGGDGRGHIIVSGLLTQTGPCIQRFEFELETDQTCLPSLVADLQSLARS